MPPREPVTNETASAAPHASPVETSVEEQAVIEAYLDQLTSENNIWEYLHRIQHVYQVPMQHRHQYYNQFIGMVAVREPADQDACLIAGHPVFHYRMETARRDVAALRQTQGDTLQIEPTVVGDDFLAEIIHVPNAVPSVKYLRYNYADGSTSIDDRVQIGSVIYMPPQTRLVKRKTLMLPTAAVEYGDTMTLLRDVRAFIQSYLHLPHAPFRNICAYYVLLTWLFDRFTVVPYLRAQGEFGTGKTRLLQVVGALAHRPVLAGGATTAAPIFRIIERFHGTLIIDEADFSEHSEIWSDITKILNIGYQSGIDVLRAERPSSNGSYEVEGFDCYGPKILSTRRRFTDQALESRCLSHTMQSGDVPEHIPLLLEQEFYDEARELRNKLLLWRCRNFRTASLNSRERFKNLDPRLNQLLLPLLAVCDDARLRNEILEHAQHYQRRFKEDVRDSIEGRVADCVIDAWKGRASTATDVLMRSINERVKTKIDDVKLSVRRVSELVRHGYGLTTFHRGGMVWVTIHAEDIARLRSKYGISGDPVVPSRVEVTVREPVRQPVLRAAPLATTNGREPVR
jgi:hypothetical protein